MATPTYKISAQWGTGKIIEVWTQDPDGLVASYREGGAFLSSDMPREDRPAATH
jgi:hypothetical protein